VERAAVRRRLTWQLARVVEVVTETARTKSLLLDPVDWAGHLAGQHVDVRLTAEDGYQAQRSYSIASAPEDGHLVLTVERLDDGEVSVFLHDVAEVGDELEVRGPIGGYFVWDADSPALLIGGGSGVVPLMAMLRLARGRGRDDLVHLLVSVRSPVDLYYADELMGRDDVTVAFTREIPEGWARPPGRLRDDDVVSFLRDDATIYVCGSAGFTDAVGDLLIEVGVPPERVRFERFGPSA
jgi:ferredoxin-NADP reductase